LIDSLSMSRWFAFLPLALLSCSGRESSSPSVNSETDTGVVEDVAVGVEETPEVCGIAVGDTFCDHTLMGYVRPGVTTGLATETPYGAYKISDVLAKSTVKYVYVYASAYW